MGQLRLTLISLMGSTIEISTEYSDVNGILSHVMADYVVIRSNNGLTYIQLTSIKSVAY